MVLPPQGPAARRLCHSPPKHVHNLGTMTEVGEGTAAIIKVQGTYLDLPRGRLLPLLVGVNQAPKSRRN